MIPRKIGESMLCESRGFPGAWFGVIAYRSLTANPDEYAAIEEERSDCVGIDALLKRAIAPERKRIATAEEFRAELRRVAQGTPS